MKSHLAIIATHPVQYHAAWFRAVEEHPQIDLKVLYCHRATPQEQASAGFNVEFDWDVSLLDGYRHRFLRNVARKPSLNEFAGLDTPEISDMLKPGNFDAVIVNGWNYKSAWQTMRACWRAKTPVMVRSESTVFTERSFAKRLLKWPSYNWFIPKLDACLPAGKWSRDYFLHYGARPEKVFTVPHAIDGGYFETESARWAPRRNELREAWRLSGNRTVFLFVGKFTEKKRPMDFLRAVDRAAKGGANLYGLMVGDGSLRSECETFVRAHDAPIRFAGFLNQSEITKAYIAADALVLPSNGGETWGLVVNEAMTCGRPCLVSSRVGCGPDLIVPGETGNIFQVGDIDALALLLSSHARQQARLSQMGVRARRQMTAHSIEAAVESTRQALTAVTRKRKT